MRPTWLLRQAICNLKANDIVKCPDMKKVLYLITFSLLLFPAFTSAQDMSQFYYPVNDLEDPKAYKYIDSETGDVAYYLYLYTIVASSDTFLITESYSPEFVKQDYRKERITGQGAELVSYVLYSDGEEIRAEVLEFFVFPWNLNEGTHSSWKVQYELKGDLVQLWKVGNLYTDDKVLNEFNGKTYEGIEFTEYFIIRNMDDERTIIFYNVSTYYEGLGLMELSRYEPNGEEVFSNEVSEILTEMEWREISGQR